MGTWVRKGMVGALVLMALMTVRPYMLVVRAANPTLNATSYGSGTLGTTPSVANVVVPSGTQLMIVCVGQDATTDPAAETVSWNTSEALSEFTIQAANQVAAVFYKVNPTATTASVTSTGWNNARTGMVVLIVDGDVNTGTPLAGLQAGTNSTLDTTTLTVSPAAGDLPVSCMTLDAGGGDPITSASGTVARQQACSNTECVNAAQSRPGNGALTWNWSSNRPWSHNAFLVQGAAASTKRPRLALMGVGEVE